MKNLFTTFLFFVAAALCVASPIHAAEPAPQKSYDSGRAAGEAFLKALEADDLVAIRAMLAPKLQTMIEKNPGFFDALLMAWRDRRGRGLTIESVGAVNESSNNEWSTPVFMSFKAEGGTVTNTVLSTRCYSKDQKQWWVSP